MITKKEKIVAAIIYKIYKESGEISIRKGDLIGGSKEKVTDPDLVKMLDYNKSLYIDWHGGSGSMVKITPYGIAYMEKRVINIVEKTGFWVTVLASVLAATYAILTYYCK